MKYGFDLFYTQLGELDTDIEKRLGIIVRARPVMYLKFLSLFDCSAKAYQWRFKIDNVMDGNGMIVPLETVAYKKVDNDSILSLSHFYSIDEIYIVKDDDEGEYIAIASSDDTGKGGLLLGIGEENCDRVYKYRWEDAEIPAGKPHLLEDDIFKFIKKLYTLEMWSDRFVRSKLFRRYGEDFWRLA